MVQFLAEGARVTVTGNNPDSIAKGKAELDSDVLALKADSASVAEQEARRTVIPALLHPTSRGRFRVLERLAKLLESLVSTSAHKQVITSKSRFP
jgi:hypothetical protein